HPFADVAKSPGTPEIVHSLNRGGARGCRRSRRRRRTSRLSAVDHVLQFLAGLEKGDLLGGKLDPGAGVWIAAHSRPALPGAETTEAANFDLVTAAQCFHDAVEDGFHDDLGILAAHLDGPRDFFNQVCFGHDLLLASDSVATDAFRTGSPARHSREPL